MHPLQPSKKLQRASSAPQGNFFQVPWEIVNVKGPGSHLVRTWIQACQSAMETCALETNMSTEREVLPLQIPRKLLFNYKINLFKAENSDLDPKEKILLANVKRTVKLFEDITGDAPEVEMWDDDHCLTALNDMQMKEGHALAFGFRREVEGPIKSDLCRLVMLYNTGGYYFDTDVAPLAALQRVLDPRATFVTVRAQRDGFFQAFVATTPKHPVIKLSLMNLVLISLAFTPF
eukprot:s444_g13.t1